jgi:hypothetical protein
MSDGTKKLGKGGSYILRFAVAAGALYLAFRGENLKQVWQILIGLNLWVFITAMSLYIASQLIFVSRWYMLMKVQSITIGFWSAVRLHFLGLFYNNCLPGSVGGDFLRAWYVTHHTNKRLVAALSVFVDRAVGLAGLIIMAFGCWWFLPASDRSSSIMLQNSMDTFTKITERRLTILWVCVTLAILLLIFLSIPSGRRLATRTAEVVRKYGSITFHRSKEAIAIYWNKKLALLWALLLTFCCQAVFIIGIWLIGAQIGVKAAGKYYFVFFPVSWLLGMLPISVGGVGIMEWWLKDVFVRVGTVGELALVLALCQRIIWLLGSLPGAAIHLLGAHLPKDFSIDYDKPIN